MTEIADRYRRLSTAFTEKVDRVPPDRWSAASPCADWTTRDLVAHVVETHGMFLGLVGRDLPADLPTVAADPLAAWTGARDAVQAGLDDPAVADLEYDGQMGRSTFAKAVDGFLGFDQVVHGWDLARSAGLDETIQPDELLRLQAMIDQMGDLLHGPGVCGPALDPPQGADEQTRVLMALGRRP